MYKHPTTTKNEMISAIEEISKLTRGVHIDRSAVNQQVGKLQTLANYLPETETKKDANPTIGFEDHWEDYHFRSKCGLNEPQFYRKNTFDFKGVKLVALHSYNVGVEDASRLAVKPSLNLKVARILKDCLVVGDFDNKDPQEEQLIEEWVHKIYIENNEDEELEIPWNL